MTAGVFIIRLLILVLLLRNSRKVKTTITELRTKFTGSTSGIDIATNVRGKTKKNMTQWYRLNSEERPRGGSSV
jgi:hypothetical protein